MDEIVPGVYVETRFRCVTVGAVLTDEGWVLIDTPPYPDDAHRWRERLLRKEPAPIVFVINTDHHRDRILGNCWFKAPVIAHDYTNQAMRSLPGAFLENAVDALAANDMERRSFTGLRLVHPSISFSDRLYIKRGGRVITLLSMPGPTPGSVWVHFPDERVVFTGDSVVVDTHPQLAFSNSKAWLDSLTALRRARFAADVIVPGRGPVADKNATESVSEYIRVARRRVYSVFRAGRPRADTSSLVPEFVAMFPVTDSYEEIQRRVKSGLDHIYEEYKAAEVTRNQTQTKT